MTEIEGNKTNAAAMLSSQDIIGTTISFFGVFYYSRPLNC